MEFGESVVFEERTRSNVVKVRGPYSSFNYADPGLEETEFRGKPAINLIAFDKLTRRYKIVTTIVCDRGYSIKDKRIDITAGGLFFEFVVVLEPANDN